LATYALSKALDARSWLRNGTLLVLLLQEREHSCLFSSMPAQVTEK
jgi:hypothetical protein